MEPAFDFFGIDILKFQNKSKEEFKMLIMMYFMALPNLNAK
jgi:hypothetical protein